MWILCTCNLRVTSGLRDCYDNGQSTDAAESSSFSCSSAASNAPWSGNDLSYEPLENTVNRGISKISGNNPYQKSWISSKDDESNYINYSFLGQGKNNPEINCYATNDFMICPYVVFLLYRRSAWCWWHLVKATDAKMLPVLPCTLCAASQHRCLCSTSWCLSIHFNVSYVAVIHDSSRVHTIDTISLRSFLFTWALRSFGCLKFRSQVWNQRQAQSNQIQETSTKRIQCRNSISFECDVFVNIGGNTWKYMELIRTFPTFCHFITAMLGFSSLNCGCRSAVLLPHKYQMHWSWKRTWHITHKHQWEHRKATNHSFHFVSQPQPLSDL